MKFAKSFRFLVYGAFLTFCVFARALNCKRLVAQAAPPKLVLPSKMELQSGELEQLTVLREKVMTLNRQRNSFPATVQLQDVNYQVIEFLGKGGEGHVLRVKHNNEDFGLKYVKYGRGVESLKEIKQKGIPSIDVIKEFRIDGVDVALLSYVHGVDVESILYSKQLDPDFIQRVRVAFEQWRILYCVNISPCAPSNVVINFQTGEFIAIDGR